MSENERSFASARDIPEDEVLPRYLAGLGGSGEREAIEVRLREDPDFRAEFDRLKLLWDRAGRALREPIAEAEIDAAWHRLATGLRSEAASPITDAAAAMAPAPSGRPVPPSTRVRNRWRRAALAALAVLTSGVGVWAAGRVLIPPADLASAPAREIVAPVGQRLTATLDDGTRIVLAPGSRLAVPATFARDARAVHLEGRAYFVVIPGAAHPFLVHAHGTVTRVLGTEFDIRAYPSGATAVVVRSGLVEVRATRGEEAARLLGEGDRAVIGVEGGIEVQTGVGVDELVGWTEGVLAFHRAPLHDVIPELERWFDLAIHLEDPAVGQRRLTATFSDEPLDVVLDTLAELVDATVERDGRQVVFSPGRPR